MSRRIKKSSIVDEMQGSYLDYSMSVIIGRALPDVRDGLKPVHKRILYAMDKLGLSHSSSFKKSATVVGEVLGKYHPHGDMAVYDTMVRMAQDFSLRYPLVEGQGNFGSIDGDNAAAYRYTEARLARIAELMLRDIDRDTVDFSPNFDGSLKEPNVLPSALPNLLVNGSSGIAVGMSTNIPPHNLTEVCDGIIAFVENPDMELDEIMKYIKGPDFPTRGLILGEKGIKKAYKTGKGKIKVQAKTHFEQASHGREKIIITEIPYQLNKTTLIEQIAGVVNRGKVDGISDLRDESDRDGIRIVVLLKQNADREMVLNRLFKYTDLRRTFGIILLAIVDGVPERLSIKEMLTHYIEHRREVIRRRSEYELRKAERRAHILEGLRKALDEIDKIIEVIKKSDDRAHAHKNLVKIFEFSDEQAKAILDMRLAQLTSLEEEKILEEYKEKIKLIEKLNTILSSKKRLDGVLIEEIKEVKEEFGDARRTEIVEGPIEDLSPESLIKDEDVVVTITKRGWVKRIPIYTYRKQGRGGRGIMAMPQKENDFISSLFIESTHDIMLIFTNRGSCYQMQVFNIPEGSRISKGHSIAQLLNMKKGEELRGVITLRDFEEENKMILLTRNGIIKELNVDAFKNAHTGGIIAQKLNEGDELIDARKIEEGNKVLLATEKGQVIRFDESELRPMGRNAKGVIGMRIDSDDRIISCVVEDENTENLLFITSNGYGKRVAIDEFRETRRGGKGVIGIKLNDKTGVLRSMTAVTKEEEVMIISKGGNIIRINTDEISKQHRPTRGVKVVNVKKNDEITDIARLPEE